MSWPASFILELERRRYAPRYVLEWVQIPFGVLRPHGGNIRLSSFVTQGYEPIISRVTSTFQGGDLRLRDWTCSPCMFDVGIIGESQRGVGIRTILQRGQAVVLKVGFGDDPTEFQAVAVGAVTGLGRSSGGWVIRCRGLEGSLSSRIAIATSEQQLGWDLASSTIVGNLTASATDVDVDDASSFRTDGQGVGAVRVTANNGDQYFCTYTNLNLGGGAGGSDRLEGLSVATFDTAHSQTSSGAAIEEVMYTSAHPLRILRRILTSTGLGTNGADDILPESWGLGIPDVNVAERDIIHYIDQTQPASGSASWHWVKPDPIEDPQTAISNWAAGGGYFLTQRRGQITARAALRPWLTQGSTHLLVTDEMIIPGSIEYEAWDPDQPVEYLKSRFLYGAGDFNIDGTESETDHIPSREKKEHVTGGLYSDTTNAAAISTELVNRLAHWDVRVPERLSFELNGWWPGLAGPGDTCVVNTSTLTSRDGSSFAGRPGLVKRCFPDWFGSTTRVELSILPIDEWVVWAPGRV